VSDANSKDNSDAESVDSVLQKMELIVEGRCSETREYNSAIKLCEFVKEKSNAVLLVEKLFPGGIQSGEEFFDRLDEIRYIVSIGRSANEGIGLLWSAAIGNSEGALRKELLFGLANQSGHHLYAFMESFYVVVRDNSFAAAFLTDCLVGLHDVAMKGGAQGGLWKGMKTLCEIHPNVALEVASQLSELPLSEGGDLGGYIVGAMRNCDLDSDVANELESRQSFFKDHTDSGFRRVYYNSWFTTYKLHGFTLGELNSIIEVGVNNNDQNNLVELAAKLIAFAELPYGLQERCVNFLGDNVSVDVGVDAKHVIPKAASKILETDCDQAIQKSTQLIRSIGPPESFEVWNAFGSYLCDLFDKSQDDFESLFEFLCQNSASEIHKQLVQKGLCLLDYKFKASDIGALASRLCTSEDLATRRLGIYLFDNFDIKEFDLQAFDDESNIKQKLLFYELQRIHIDANSIARILSAIARKRSGTSESFDDELKDEVVLQCRNYAGACRSEFERVGSDIPMIATSIKEVRDYFESLDKARKAGINSMQVPGYLKAAKLQRKLFSRQVRKSADQHSSFLNMMKKIQLLYGQTSSQYINGILSDARPLMENSFSMETPVFEFCDPEQMGFRRLMASAKIDELNRNTDGNGGDENEC